MNHTIKAVTFVTPRSSSVTDSQRIETKTHTDRFVKIRLAKIKYFTVVNDGGWNQGWRPRIKDLVPSILKQ